jgi:REP element-mobilizing transposase RayT
MGEVEAKKDEVTGYELRHDRHTVSLLTDYLVFSPKYSVGWIAKRIKGRSSKLLRDQFPQLKGWCPGQFYADFPSVNQILQSKIGQYWAPSCYHKTFQKSFINKLLEKV